MTEKQKKELAGKEYLSPREAAVVLGTSYENVLSLMKSGKLKYGTISPRCRRISRAAIDDFVTENQSEGSHITITVKDGSNPNRVSASVVKALAECARSKTNGQE